MTLTPTGPGFGVVTTGPTLDPEVSTSSPLCGKATRYSTLLTGVAGAMTVANRLEPGPGYVRHQRFIALSYLIKTVARCRSR